MAALTACLLLLPGCSSATISPQPERPASKPNATATPAPSPVEEPEAPDPYDGWQLTEFANGFASIKTPPGVAVSIDDRTAGGEPPRYLGGSVLAFPNTEHVVQVGILTAASSRWQNGIICGQSVIASYDGAAGVAEPNRLWVTTTVQGNYRYVNMMLASDEPLGEDCLTVVELPVPAGGVMRAVMHGSMDSSVAEADVAAWVDTEEARDVIKAMQSIAVW